MLFFPSNLMDYSEFGGWQKIGTYQKCRKESLVDNMRYNGFGSVFLLVSVKRFDKDILDNCMLPPLWHQFGKDTPMFGNDSVPLHKVRSIRLNKVGVKEY